MIKNIKKLTMLLFVEVLVFWLLTSSLLQDAKVNIVAATKSSTVSFLMFLYIF